jgi:hypothetical protein
MGGRRRRAVLGRECRRLRVIRAVEFGDRRFGESEEAGSVTSRPPTGEAVNLLKTELQSLASPDVEAAWCAFLRFGRRRFDTPVSPDADGLLFQYGTHAFDGPETFVVDLTRQFEVADSDGDHDHYLQVHCELRCGSASELQELQSFDSWFFHDSDEDLDRWAKGVQDRAAWSTIRALKPVEVRVYEEPV